MNLNLFGDDDDVQSSGFSANLKLETYDPLIIAFDSITSVRDKQDKPAGKQGKDDTQDKGKDKDKDKQDTTQLIHILNQKMIVMPNASSLPVDLDEAQKNTQNTSCDYLVYVPTSFDVAKEKVDAFYETEHQFKKMFGKLNMKDAAATVFMQWDQFQRFVKYANQNKHKRALQWIQQSFQDANNNKQIVVNDMKNVRGLNDLTAANNTVNLDEKGDERFVILYTTPVSTDIPVTTVNSLLYLPFASKFCNDTLDPNKPFSMIIPQKALTYYCNYFQLMYMKNDRTNNIHGSFGRITNYLPQLSSKMVGPATKVNYINTRFPVSFAIPSYNVEIMPFFLTGIITGNNLPNRNVFRDDNKLKPIQEKTRLYTFKSTPDYNLNYEKLLERLYYKYPCHLTPNVKVAKEAKIAIKEASNRIPGAPATYFGFIDRAIGASTTTKSYSIICAVAIATREFITNEVSTIADADSILTHLFTTINFGGGANAPLKPQIQTHLIAYAVAPFAGRQLNPLIGAACAAGDAVYAAAKLAITNYVKDNAVAATGAADSREPALAAIQNAMDFEIDNFDNFAAFAYDNDTLLSLLKYSDKAQGTGGINAIAAARDPNVAANLLPRANYLKTLYAPKDKENENQKQTLTPQQLQQQQKTEFETVHDDELYVICGPVYFDYTWIFKQNPELIQHILGKMSETDLKELKEGWTPVEDPLTENKYHINPNPEASYPKMRFDNPTKMPESNEKLNTGNTGTSTYSWKEQYVSPSQANDNKKPTNFLRKQQQHNQFVTRILANVRAMGQNYDSATQYATVQHVPNPDAIPTRREQDLNSIYNWTTPGYYQYECTQKIAKGSGVSRLSWIHKYVQLMRPPTYENGVQDYTEPNLPTAYPPPLMSIVPPFRGPANTFVIHAWFPGETFISEDGTLNQRACMDYMYKMMQLIFKTAEKNASNIASKKRICIKIAAIGYESQVKKVNRPEDRQFIGDAFFSALRDYSMLYETTIRVTLYYDTTTQQPVKRLYEDYVNQRLSVLRKSDPLAMDTSLHLKIANMDDFFTLKWYPELDQLSKNDLLYFVDYCSSPRAFIGNMGEWPENIEEVMDDAIKGTNPQPLLACLNAAFVHIQQLYIDRGIKEKMVDIFTNLQSWSTGPIVGQNGVNTQVDAFETIVNNVNAVCADSGGVNVGNVRIGNDNPDNLMISWWKANDLCPKNAYISSFDEHVMILHNLFSNSNDVDSNRVNAGWPNNAPSFDIPDNVNATPNSRNTTVNHGPYVVNSFAQNRNDTFENAVYAYTQAKKILTLLSKMKYDEIQITKANHDRITAALAELNKYTVKMSWSMDAKFTAAVAEGAFIPNSSALHNPFMCPTLLDPKEWQFMDFDDVGVREIAGADPITPMLKPFIDAKIKGGASAVATSRALIISKQPNVDRLKKNAGVILENMFHRNDPMRYAGKNAVFSNYAWNKKLFYKKRNDKVALQQLNYPNKSPDFARLMGLRPSGKCINFPLFAIHLTMYLYQGNLSDMTGMDVARLSCSLDGNMFKTNAQIIWDQMMKNLKEKEKNFTVEQVLGRLGRPTTTEDYGYTAYFDIPMRPPIGSANILINCTNAATNPTFKTTNYAELRRINNLISDADLLANAALYNNPIFQQPNLNSIPAGGPYNSIRSLTKIAEIFNDVEMRGVAGVPLINQQLTDVQNFLRDLTNMSSSASAIGAYYNPVPITPNWNSRLGWNAATQRESTVLYMNKMAKKNGVMMKIASELLSLQPGDKIMITDETANVNVLKKQRQVWRVTGKPKSNPIYATIIDVPVTYAEVSLLNVPARVVDRNIGNDVPLIVTLERFVQDEELD
jgi:hypothetical protein